MTPEKKTKQKILALLTVVLLFLLTGYTLFLISLNNKNKTEILQKKVALIKAEQEKKRIETENLAKINLATSTAPQISAQAFLTIAVTDSSQKKILLQKNPDWALPIASLTKLMTAVIALENAKKETRITATLDYIGQEESAFVLETNKIYTVSELLSNALVSSDNDSARLLSSLLGETNFIAKMNQKAGELGLSKTNFFNVTGLDPQKPDLNANLSSPTDLATLLLYLKNNHPEILKNTTEAVHSFCTVDNYCKPVNNTNKLLLDPNFKYKIIGGKTGSTDLALKNLVIIAEPLPGISLINIVLGSTDNFADTVALINNIIIK